MQMQRRYKEDGLTLDDYYSIGVTISKRLPRNYEFSEIARALGMTKQGAQYLALVALGKLVHRLRKEASDGR